jgi:hypothetical protein
LGDQLKALGIVPLEGSRSSIKQEIDLTGASERLHFSDLDIPELAEKSASLRLGWGWHITEFLTAPLGLEPKRSLPICSLGALVNLMVVTCDELLDSGSPIQEVLPNEQLHMGGDASSVMKMLRQYFLELDRLGLSGPTEKAVRKVVANMFAAEIASVQHATNLPYRFWLRKCCLPLVLMALPAAKTSLSQHYSRWLYRVGRFFGMLDDALDFENDVQRHEANRLIQHSEASRESMLTRVAHWGASCLNDWDNGVFEIDRYALARDTFLSTIWGC